MSKFNTRSANVGSTTSPVRSGAPTQTAEGGAGYSRDAKSELFLLAITNMVGEDTFYEAAGNRDARFIRLIHAVTQTDPAWVAAFIPFLRNEMHMRTASVVMAAEYAIALRSLNSLNIQQQRIKHTAPAVRQVVSSALVRPDEPAEFVAYWRMRARELGHPQGLPGGVCRGVADAAVRLYTERNVLKYDGNRDAIRFADVIRMSGASWDAHPSLFPYLIDQRRGRSGDAHLEKLPMIRLRKSLELMTEDYRRPFLRNMPQTSEFLRGVGATWEWLSGWLPGGMDAEAWQWIIPNMGSMALIRNLRNFDEKGVSSGVAQIVAEKISDPAEVRRSGQFPFRYFAAYKAVQNSLRWAYPIEKALQASLSNVPELSGRTLILVDRSQSMFWENMSKRSELTRADGAAVFGTALALRAESADLFQYGSGFSPIRYGKGDSVLPLLRQFGDLGGTNTAATVNTLYNGHDRIIIVTDEQAHDGLVFRNIPAHVKCYTWNLAGYAIGHDVSGSGNRHTFGGLSDAAFRMIPLIEKHRSVRWEDLFTFGTHEGISPAVTGAE